MPYEWTTSDSCADRRELILWPHRSLSRQGFATFIAASTLILALPLLSLTGTPALWMILPFACLAPTAVWLALGTNDRARRIGKVLTLTGADREVEIGRFLAPEDRATLADELRSALARLG